MNFSVLLRKIQRNKEDFGTARMLKKIVLYLLKPIYEKKIYRIYGIDLNRFQSKPYCKNNFIFKSVDWNDRQLINQIEKMEEWLSGKIVSRLKKGSVCLVALDGNRVVGFNLVNFGEVFMPLVRIEKIFNKDEAWSEQITVSKDYRGKGLATDLRYMVFKELKDRGINRFYGGTLIDNEANLKLTRKVGFWELVDIHYFKLFPFKKWKYEELRNEQKQQIRHPFH